MVCGAGDGPQASELLKQIHYNTLQPKGLPFILVTSGNFCLKNEYSLWKPGDSLYIRHSASCWGLQDISWHQGLVLQKAKCSKDRREGKGFLRVKAGHTLSSFRSVPQGGPLYTLAGNKLIWHQSAAPSSERGFVVRKHMAACLHVLPSTCGERPLIIKHSHSSP